MIINCLYLNIYCYTYFVSSSSYLMQMKGSCKWLANALPADDLYTENAIMIKRFNRYPLVVDLSGQATEF